jgi:hypothetical protein
MRTWDWHWPAFLTRVTAGLLLPVAITLGFLLLTVTYGHALLEPLFNANSHTFPRLTLLLPAMAQSPMDDSWSIDAAVARRTRDQPQ